MTSSFPPRLFLTFLSLLMAGIWSASTVKALSPESFELARLENVTDKLALRPLLNVSFAVSRGIDTRWKAIGDYNFNARIVKYGLEGLTFDWTMSYPADASGSRAVAPEDLKTSTKVSLFYPKNESCTLVGFTNAIRVSDRVFQALKSGQKTVFALDGPEVPPGHARDPRLTAHCLTPYGQEYVPVYVNDRKAKVRTIKATTDNGWTYWIMDNERFPMMVAGSGPFFWHEPRFDTSTIDAEESSKQIIDDLETRGEATTHAILFDFNKAVIKARSKPILDKLGQYLCGNTAINLSVAGHTDSIGSLAYNMALSRRRAQAVVDYLVNKCGVEAGRLTPDGFGYTQPAASNATEQGRACNRRVVFKKI